MSTQWYGIYCQKWLQSIGFDSLDVIVTKRVSVVDEWVQENVLKRTKDGPQFIGIDIEWQPRMRGGADLTSVLQLATERSVLVVQLMHLDEPYLPPSIEEMLKDTNIIKVGHCILEDARRLKADWGLDCLGRVDLHKMAEDLLIEKRALSTLVRLYLPDCDAFKELQINEWEKRHLNKQEIMYAALDAWFARALYFPMLARLGATLNTYLQCATPEETQKMMRAAASRRSRHARRRRKERERVLGGQSKLMRDRIELQEYATSLGLRPSDISANKADDQIIDIDALVTQHIAAQQQQNPSQANPQPSTASGENQPRKSKKKVPAFIDLDDDDDDLDEDSDSDLDDIVPNMAANHLRDDCIREVLGDIITAIAGPDTDADPKPLPEAVTPAGEHAMDVPNDFRSEPSEPGWWRKGLDETQARERLVRCAKREQRSDCDQLIIRLDEEEEDLYPDKTYDENPSWDSIVASVSETVFSETIETSSDKWWGSPCANGESNLASSSWAIPVAVFA
eukprot:TRINITY_DN9105_c0_g1::TRINITY_DN9105_c0_g1_i1::g.18182::m.18182 TRINITY_DN9105_c0_g1::TRINITY_DN9105_c0_g1_i1::g.18182  ORF type:complete len:510 (-),score=100.06,sp/Q84LH3/WEX_ARATH/28.66/7e-12,DNA_pol_A_exo1/PF01612.15/5.4e-15 TRINITY_DN9105_c0_g1_i1:435-1964(-)